MLSATPDGLRVSEMMCAGTYSYQQITGSLIRLEGKGVVVSDDGVPRTYRIREGSPRGPSSSPTSTDPRCPRPWSSEDASSSSGSRSKR